MYRHDDNAISDARNLVPTHHTGVILTPNPFVDYRDRYRGAMLGTAIGDALGRPAEGRSPRNIRKVFGELTDFQPWLGWTGGPTGTFTDDTEMALCIAQSIVERQGVDPDDPMTSPTDSVRGEGSDGVWALRRVQRAGGSVTGWRGTRQGPIRQGTAQRCGPRRSACSTRSTWMRCAPMRRSRRSSPTITRPRPHRRSSSHTRLRTWSTRRSGGSTPRTC
ncbi:MAG: hypothetical protein GWP12_02200 [Nitrospirae bacterium]|nr:hypothetical protein [Nitrospirota bacterium]